MVEAQIPDTMKARNLTEEEVERDVMFHVQPTKKFVSIEEVAGFAVFLYNETAKNITGAMISMDGDWSAQ